MANSGLKVLSSNSVRLRFYFSKDSTDSTIADRSALKEAIKGDDIKRVFELLNAGIDANLPVDPTWDHTPLILATCFGAYKVFTITSTAVSQQKRDKL